MIRWKYLLPRVAILGVILLAVLAGGNPLLRWMLVRSGESITGAKVEIGQVRASLLRGQIQLTDVEFADPRYPMRNMLQADLVTLRLDPRRLLHREMVVQQARLAGVLFGTPRTQSGALDDRETLSLEQAQAALAAATQKLQKTGRNWLEQLGQQLPAIAENQLHTVRVANEINRRWERDLKYQRDRARRLSHRVGQLGQVLGKPHRNPLRDQGQFLIAIDELQSLDRDIESAHHDVHRLKEQLEIDRRKLLDAAERDRDQAEQLAAVASFDEGVITQILLGEQQAARIDEVLAWIHWFRSSIPDPDTDFEPARMRGFDVQFQRRPKLLIQQLQLDGRGRLAGQMFEFSGIAKNISNAPKLHEHPTTFELRGQAKSHVIVAATLDRRGPQRRDHLRFHCSSIEIPRQTLGADSGLVLDVEPSVLQFEIDAKLVDDQIRGKFVFRTSGVDIAVGHLDPRLGGDGVASALNEQLESIDQFSVVIDLDGRIDDPSFDIRSDLTNQLSAMLHRAVENSWRAATAQRVAEIDRIHFREAEQLGRMFDTEIGEIVQLLHSESPAVARLQKMIPSINGSPTIR